jgi:zinc transport system permease protein
MFEYQFMQNALIVGLIVGIVAPLVGIFLVMRRLSLIADALSHISLSGIATGLWLQSKWIWFQTLNPIYLGMLFSVIGALFVDRLRQVFRGYQEIAIPIVMALGIAGGIVLISAADGFNVDVAGYLFGNILVVSRQELMMTAIAGLIVVLFIFTFYKQLFAIHLDEEFASFSGVPKKWIQTAFIVIVSLVIAAAIRVVGILLVSALMTLPVAISLQIAQSFRQAFVGSILVSQVAVIIGLMMAYTFDLASGGAIVLVLLTMLLLTIAGKKMLGRFRKETA